MKKQKIIMELIADGGATYTDIIKTAYELSHGKGSYYHPLHRGYWSGVFEVNTYHPMYGSKRDGWVTKYCEKIGKKYFLNELGKEKLKSLQ